MGSLETLSRLETVFLLSWSQGLLPLSWSRASLRHLSREAETGCNANCAHAICIFVQSYVIINHNFAKRLCRSYVFQSVLTFRSPLLAY